MKIKALLYCTKAKPYLVRNESDKYWYTMQQFQLDTFKNVKTLNGKIVAECDFEVEDLRIVDDDPLGAYWYETKTLSEREILEKSCLTSDELFEYLGEDNEGYAIHIKNLHIFDKPKELSEVYKIEDVGGMLFTKPLTKAPQNMMRVSINHWNYATYNPNDIRVLISIQSQWMCLILNHIKDVEVRRVVLKEMI